MDAETAKKHGHAEDEKPMTRKEKRVFLSYIQKKSPQEKMKAEM
mgnify:CR=1 FL=1